MFKTHPTKKEGNFLWVDQLQKFEMQHKSVTSL